MALGFQGLRREMPSPGGEAADPGVVSGRPVGAGMPKNRRMVQDHAPAYVARLRHLGLTISRQSAENLPLRAHSGDTDPSIPVVRAQHLIHYIDVLRDAGMPVERALERSRLPVSIEQTPNDYVSLPHALDWVGAHAEKSGSWNSASSRVVRPRLEPCTPRCSVR
jgi:hypothetical protein